MPTDHRQRLEELFLRAVDLPAAERAALLNEGCAGEPALRAELEAMLAEDASGTRGLLAVPAASLVEQADEPMPERIGPFRTLRVLGEGGMGRVYEAEQDSPRRTVALKVIQPGVVTRSSLRRFEQEAQMLAGLKHPGIAQIHQAGSVTTAHGAMQPYFAMELVRGPEINEFVRSRSLGVRETLALLAKVCDAVQHAHQRGVIHRDLKPGNILVEDAPEGPADETATRAGVPAQPKILDFGVARLADRESASASLRTEAGALVGTLAYMSPEQVDADPAQIDTRADVYALGVIGYELLAGAQPIEVQGRPILEAVRMVRDAAPIALGRRVPALRGDVETIIAKAMEKDPSRRYASAAELAADIRRFLHDQPIAARPASTLYHFGKFARRNRALVAAACIGLVALTGGAAALAIGLVRANRAEAEASQRAIAEARERAAAEHRFAQVRELARTLIFDIHNQIKDLSGSIEAQRTIVQTGLQYLDTLAAEATGDPALQRELAGGYRRIGEILGDPAKSNIGDTPGAIDAVGKAVALLDVVWAASPDDPKISDELHTALDSLVALQRTGGRLPDAIKTAGRSLDLARRMTAADPSDKNAQENLVVSDANIGRMKETMGDFAGAIEHYRRARAYFYGLTRGGEDLSEPRIASNVVVITMKISEGLREIGRNAEAEMMLRDTIGWSHRLLERHPNHAGVRTSDWAISLALGRSLVEDGCIDEALPLLWYMCSGYQAASESDPKDVRARRNLGIGCYWLSKAYVEKAQFETALFLRDRYRETTAAVWAMNPGYNIAAHDAALGEAFYARSLGHLGRLDEAAEHYSTAIAMLCRLFFDDPATTLHSVGLVEHLADLGEVHLQLAAQCPPGSDERSRREILARESFGFGRAIANYAIGAGQVTLAVNENIDRIDKGLAALGAAR